MAISAGIGVLIGLGIGAGITAFFMQRIIRRQDNALQQSLNRLNRIQEDHAQELNSTLAKIEADYEQKLATKIERYQDSQQEQLTDLEAEYQARIAALGNFDPDDAPAESIPLTSIAAPPQPSTAPPQQVSSFTTIPDPWMDEGMAQPVKPVAAEPASTLETAPTAEPASSEPASPKTIKQQTPNPDDGVVTQITEIGKAAALNRKVAIRTVPQLGKLTKDNNADVRLAAITALQESGSIKAIPFLRQALRDPDSRVVAAANAGLSRFKGAKKSPKKLKKNRKKPRR